MSNCIKDLSHSTAFELLSSEEREILEKKKVTIKYEKGEAIIKQGTLANSMLFINKGMSKLFVEGTQKKVIITIKAENSFLGLSSIYQKYQTHQYSVTALEHNEISVYDKDDFKKVMNLNIAFANEIVMYLNHVTSKIYARFLCVAEKNARGKVADMILCMANNLFGCLSFTIPLSRQELAEFAGLSMENTIRILKEFESDNLIKLKNKTFEIIEKEKLERISKFG